MSKSDIKTLNFIYQDTEIHFLINPLDDNVLVNATEMAKLFNKQIDNFTRLSSTKKFISALLIYENSKFVPSDVREQITEIDIIYGTNKATYMHRKLALYFAFWLDIDFQIWVIDKIEKILFGNYKKHWDAHVIQTNAEDKAEELKAKLHIEPTVEIVKDYFKELAIIQTAKTAKRKAISNQLKMEL